MRSEDVPLKSEDLRCLYQRRADFRLSACLHAQDVVWSKFSNACFRFSLRFGYRRLFPVEFGRFVTSYI